MHTTPLALITASQPALMSMAGASLPLVRASSFAFPCLSSPASTGAWCQLSLHAVVVSANRRP